MQLTKPIRSVIVDSAQIESARSLELRTGQCDVRAVSEAAVCVVLFRSARGRGDLDSRRFTVQSSLNFKGEVSRIRGVSYG